MLKRKLLTTRAAAALMGTAIAVGAIAVAAPASATTGVAGKSEAKHEAVVAAFTDANAAPQFDADASKADQVRYEKDLAAYWKRVPWTSVYGQWGYTVDSVKVDYHETAGDWGSAGAEVLVGATPTGETAPANLVGQVATKTALQSTPKSVSRVAAGTLAAQAQSCGQRGDILMCLNQSGSSLQGAVTNSKTAITGNIRLGNVGLGGTCGPGSLVGQSGKLSTGNGQVVTYSHSISSRSKYSGQFNVGSSNRVLVCGTYGG